MSTFVLVHGAWQAASTWDLVTPILQAAGHAVTIPRLSGLENDSCLLSPAIGLQTHIDDVIRVLNRENLQDVTLVGHSYAGMIITGVAEHALDRLSRLVYVDAFVPSDGQSALDLLPEKITQIFRQQADAAGEGWRLRAGEGQLDLWGLKPGANRDFVRSRLSDFSLRCFEEKVRLPANAALNFPEPSLLAWPRRTPRDPYFSNSVTAPNGRAGNITNYSPAMIVTWKCPKLSCQSCLDEKPLLPLISLGSPSTEATLLAATRIAERQSG